MSNTIIDIGDDVAMLLDLLEMPPDRAARELIVLELYRRGTISAGRAAQVLRLGLEDFIRWSGGLGIPFMRYSPEELEEDVRRLGSR